MADRTVAWRTDGPTVRAVVVNWNGKHLLGACLDSLLGQDAPPGAIEIVVVDNASTDGSVAYLRQEYPAVTVVVNAENRGFAGGVNAGLTGLTAPYVALLNNDATFEAPAVGALIAALESPENADAAAATALILLSEPDEHGRVLVNSTGNVVSKRGSAHDRDWLTPLSDLHAPADVFGFCGGAAVLRATALDQVGGFDDSLFLYYEDTDLSWRFREHGWRVIFVAGAIAHHLHSASSDPASALFRYYNNRNALIVLTRHAPATVAARAFARQLGAVALHAVRRDEPSDVIRARVKALRDYLRTVARR